MIELARGLLYHPESSGAPARFAAEELSTHLERMFGHRPALRAVRGDAGDWLVLAPAASAAPRPSPPPREGEWTVTPADGALWFAARSGRALLAAVYGLLEAMGCRWSPHGADEEHIPAAREARLIGDALVGRPAFARRAYASDLTTWHYSMPERLAQRLPGDRAFIDWIAKSGGTGMLFIRHAHDTQWTVPELVPELQRRGLAVEAGGHVLPELLPRPLFATHPEYFPESAAGLRTDCGNACASSPGALEVVHRQTAAARDALPAGSDFHLWGADLFGGGWCRCSGCALLTPSDQLLRVCNAAAAAHDGRLFYLAYHDTLSPPQIERPSASVWAEFAPRERCYGHALDDPTCATNRPYREALERLLDCFAGRVDAFEYYADAILFGGCAVPLVDVMARDLGFYLRVGVRGLSCLQFGAYSLLAHGVNVEAFARGTIDPSSVAQAREGHCERAFGPAAAGMGRYLLELERLMALVVTYGDVALPPRQGERARGAHAALEAALTRAPDLRRLLGDVASAPSRRQHAEMRLLEYTLTTLGGVRTLLAGGADAVEQALALLADALGHVRAIDAPLAGTWGTYDLEMLQAVCAASFRSAPR